MKKIKELFNKLYVYKETEIEKKSRELIESLLELPTTNKIMAADYYVYLANDDKKIYITFDGNSLLVVRENDYVDVTCNAKFASSIQRILDSFIVKSIEEIGDKMKNKKFEKISDITNSIKI